MIQLRLFGGLELSSSEGRALDSVLTQPKRVALLAFLATSPQRFHRRDTLLALFWPELDQEHARAALRQALHSLRRALDTDVLASRGDEEVGVDEQALWCDVRAYRQALEAGDFHGALQLYRGGLLEGFFLSGSPEFERWLEDERSRLRDSACQAAWTLAQRSQAEGDLALTAQWARRAAALVPADEEMLRRLVTLLDELGDRGGAIQVYEEFARRVAGDYEAEPAAETKALMALVRSREEPSLRPPPTPRARVEALSAPPSTPRAARLRRRGWIAVSVGLAVLATLVVRGHLQTTTAATQALLAIVPLENRSGDSLDDYLAAALTEDIVSSLAAAHMLRVFHTRPGRSNADYTFTGTIQRAKETLGVTAQLRRTSSGEIIWATHIDHDPSQAAALPDVLAAQVLTALGVRPARAPVDLDLCDLGRQLIPRRTPGSLVRAVGLLSECVGRDSSYAPGWAGLARALHSAYRLGIEVPGIPRDRDSVLSRAVAASERALELDSASVEAWLSRAHVSIGVDPTSREPALRAIRRAIALDSLNAQAWHRLGLTLEEVGNRDSAGLAWRQAVALDPAHYEALAFLALHYWWWRQYDSAAVWADSAVAIDPLYQLGRVVAGQVALERGRRDDAESQLGAALRLGPGAANAGLSGFVALAAAAGDTVGARRLVAEAKTRGDSLALDVHNAVNIAASYAALGDVKRALRWLERFRPVRDLHFQLHLRRDPPLDPLRREPRFQALLVKEQ